MDRNEMNLRIEALKAAMHQHDYEKAAEIADELDLRRIRDNYFLSLVADAYEMCHEYDKSKDALLTAYENTNAGRQLAYRLCLISIKTKEYEEAEEFYEDFVEMAPRDTGRYILKYKMSKAQGATTEKLIEILEEYVNLDMDEKWAYELAKLYHLSGDQEKCVDMCDEISLWFAEGQYVLKALELKKKYQPLSALQKQKYEEGKEKSIEEASKAEIEKIAEKQKDAESPKNEESISEPETSESEGIVSDDEISAGESEFNTTNIEEIVAKGMEEFDELDEESFDNKDISVTEKIEIQKDIEEAETAEDSIEEVTEPEIKDLGDVQDILKQLEQRGILKAETVNQAVTIIEEAGNEENKELDHELAIIDEESEREERERLKHLESEQSGDEAENNENTEETENIEPTEDSIDDIDAGFEIDSAESEVDNIEKTKAIPDLGKIISEQEKQGDNDSSENTETAPDEESNAEETVPDGENVPVLDLGFETEKKEASEEVQENVENDVISTEEISVEVEMISGEETEAGEAAEETEPGETEEETELGETEEETESENSDEEIEDGGKAEETEAGEKAEETESEEGKEEMEEKNQEAKSEEAVRPGIVLMEDELEVFKNYLNVEGLESNIRDTIQDLIDNYTPDGKSTDGNVIILGDKRTGKTTLAIELIRLVNKKRGRRDRKLAKIHANALNRRGFKNSLGKLVGSDLIIEDAHELEKKRIDEIIRASEMFTDDMLMILEGDTKGLKELMESVSHITDVFDHVIEIKEYDIKEWVEYGKKYAKENGCVMDKLASLALYKAIDDCFGEKKGISKEDVESILDDAMKKCKKKHFGVKKDDEGNLIMSEKNFR